MMKTLFCFGHYTSLSDDDNDKNEDNDINDNIDDIFWLMMTLLCFHYADNDTFLFRLMTTMVTIFCLDDNDNDTFLFRWQ